MMRLRAQSIMTTATLIAVLLAACRPGPAATPPAPTNSQPTPAAGTLAPPTAVRATAAAAMATPPPPTPTAEEPFVLLAPDPLRVAPVLDTERAVTGVILAAGGSLSARAADGSAFTLTVPEGALLNDQQIVLTPLLNVEGQELSGGFAAGVHLAPAGLQLLAAASLTIVPASPIPVENELSFAIHGPDNEALLFPLMPAQEAATFLITHFSGYYLAEGNEADRAAQLARSPSEAGDQILQQIHSLVMGERVANLGAGPADPEFDAKVAAMLRSFLRQSLVPRIAQAETSDDWRFVCRVIADVTGFKRMLELMGGVPDLGAPFDHDAIMDRLLARQARLLKAHAEALCNSGYRLLGWLYMLRVARTQVVKQADYGVSLSDWQGRCPPLTLGFASRITRTMRWQSDGVSRLVADVMAHASVPLRYDTGQWAFVGDGPLALMVLGGNSLAGVSGHGDNRYCALNWAPAGSTLRVDKLTVNLNPMECSETRQPDTDAGMQLSFDPGLPNENWSQDCSNIQSAIRLDNDTLMQVFVPWVDLFRLYHRDQLEEGKPAYVEGRGEVFSGPSKIKFDQWRLALDAASAYAVIEQFSQTPTCPTCTYLDSVEDTHIELR